MADGSCGAFQPIAALHAQVARFDPAVRDRALRFAAHSRAQHDLLFTFPAAALALVTARDAPAARARAARLVSEGAPLPRIALALDLPTWARRLLPETLGATLPCALRRRPDDDVFARQFAAVDVSPSTRDSEWLRDVLAARQVSTEFAVWFARCRDRFDNRANAFVYLAAYAFFSAQPSTPAGALITTRWRKQMTSAAAALACLTWLQRMVLSVHKDSRPPEMRGDEVWLRAPYTLHLLDTSEALLTESFAMRNCVDDRVMTTAAGESWILSVREDRRRVANVEIAITDDGDLYVEELLGPGNAPAPEAVHACIDAWLSEEASHAPGFTRDGVRFTKHISPGVWSRYWQPFLTATGLRAPIVKDAIADGGVRFLAGAESALDRAGLPFSPLMLT